MGEVGGGPRIIVLIAGPGAARLPTGYLQFIQRYLMAMYIYMHARNWLVLEPCRDVKSWMYVNR